MHLNCMLSKAMATNEEYTGGLSIFYLILCLWSLHDLWWDSQIWEGRVHLCKIYFCVR